jgi:hypothetical protein
MFTISSKDRKSGTSSNFNIDKIHRDKVKGFRVDYISLPYTWYNVSTSNNTIVVNGSNVSISAGYYNITTLCSALQTALVSVDATFTCTYSSSTGKVTIARSTNFTLNLSSSSWTLRRQIGFNGTSNVTGATTFTSDSIVNINNGNSAYLHCSPLGKYIENQTTDNRSDFIISIPIDKSPQEIIYYVPPVENVYTFSQEISLGGDQTFYFTDIDRNVLNLNGAEWEMKLIFI